MITFVRYKEEMLDDERVIKSNSQLYRRLSVGRAAEWCSDPMVQQMVRDVDRTEWVTADIFSSPWLGTIDSNRLSGGVKGLILLLKATEPGMPRIFMDHLFGENCLDWMMRIGQITDFTILIAGSLAWRECKEPIVGQTLSGKPINCMRDMYVLIDQE